MIAIGKPPGLDVLVAEAANLYRELVQSERGTVVTYWQFGRLLERLRPQYVGDWMDFLKTQGWSYSRVKRAVRISNRYARVEDCQDRTLMQALDYTDTPRKKKVRKVRPPKTKVEEKHPEDDADEPQEPSPPTGPTSPADDAKDGDGLPLRHGEDGDDDAALEGDGQAVASEEPPVEPLTFTNDELQKADAYAASFPDQFRALTVLANVVLQGDARNVLARTVTAARAVLTWAEIREIVTAAELQAKGMKAELI
jgi:hypothetical protein